MKKNQEKKLKEKIDKYNIFNEGLKIFKENPE